MHVLLVEIRLWWDFSRVKEVISKKSTSKSIYFIEFIFLYFSLLYSLLASVSTYNRPIGHNLSVYLKVSLITNEKLAWALTKRWQTYDRLTLDHSLRVLYTVARKNNHFFLHNC